MGLSTICFLSGIGIVLGRPDPASPLASYGITCSGIDVGIYKYYLTDILCIMAGTIKSRYKPEYPRKYKGDPNNIICRSSGNANSAVGVT